MDAVFSVLEAAEGETFNELGSNKRKSLTAILKALKRLPPEQRSAAKKALSQLASYGKKALISGLEEGLAEKELPKLPKFSDGVALIGMKKSSSGSEEKGTV